MDVLVAIEADVTQPRELAVALDLLQQNRAQLGGDAPSLPWQEGGQQQVSESGRKIRAVGQAMPLGETEVQGERWWVGQVIPCLHCCGRTRTIHQKTGPLKPSASGEIDDRCIHTLRQAEVVGMKQWWLAVLVLTGLGTESGLSLIHISEPTRPY